jgi:hypothetical protein
MVGAILVLAVLLGLGLRLARWIDGLPLRAIEAIGPGGNTPGPRGSAGLFGTGL